MMEGQLKNPKPDLDNTNEQITILNQILIISMHIASLVKNLLFTQVIIQKWKYGRLGQITQ